MIKSQNLDKFTSELDSLCHPVGFLFLNERHYPIVSLDNYAENDEKLASDREISHFELDRQHYVVLVERPTTESIESIPLMEGNGNPTLTKREKQIATLIALGRQNKQIAKQLNISEWTVSTHLRRIFIKLGVDNRAAMVYQFFLSNL